MNFPLSIITKKKAKNERQPWENYIPLNGSSDFGTFTDIRCSKFFFENNSINVTQYTGEKRTMSLDITVF